MASKNPSSHRDSVNSSMCVQNSARDCEMSLTALSKARWEMDVVVLVDKINTIRCLQGLIGPHILQQSVYLLETIWLFTLSDLKTIVGPQSAFGTLTALAANIFEQSNGSSSSVESILLRLPATVFWTYINLLPFTISNQRHASSVSEDMINKPWRPLPSGRLKPSQAFRLMTVLYAIAVLASIRLGGLRQSVALIILGFCYNDAGGADNSCILRNLINSCGFISFASGAMEIALGQRLLWTWPLIQWFSLIGLVIFFTVQTQDMSDAEGDSLRGRRTVPLVVGDRMARWSIAVFVGLFSATCPLFWSMNWIYYLIPIVLGATVALRTLSYRDVGADKGTFRLWNIWLVSLYCLPVLRYFDDA